MRYAAIALVVFLAACPKPTPTPPVEAPIPVAQVKKPIEVPTSPTDVIDQVKRNFQRVHFEFDSTALTADSMAALRENADIMQKVPTLRVEVQGHADERGTTEYNMALGQQRGQAISQQLTNMGVGRDRVTVISYGEERPLSGGTSETVWAQNRRAEFRVISGVEGAIIGGTTN